MYHNVYMYLILLLIYLQHMNSDKHASKLRQSKNPNKKRYFPYWKKKTNVIPKGQLQSLSNNFVSGGFTYQS